MADDDRKVILVRTKSSDADVIIGWTVRYKIGNATYLAPLAIDGRDYYEYEIDATNHYLTFVHSGIEAEMEPVWGKEVIVPVHKDTRPRCHFHADAPAYYKVVFAGNEIPACSTCCETLTSVGAEIVERL